MHILPSLRTGDMYSTDRSGSVAVYTPEEFWPLPNQQLTFNESVKYGLDELDDLRRASGGMRVQRVSGRQRCYAFRERSRGR